MDVSACARLVAHNVPTPSRRPNLPFFYSAAGEIADLAGSRIAPRTGHSDPMLEWDPAHYADTSRRTRSHENNEERYVGSALGHYLPGERSRRSLFGGSLITSGWELT